MYQTNENCDLSIGTIEKTLEATIYPNPTMGPVTISMVVDNATVLNMTGKVVFQTKNNAFYISHLQKGVYFVRVEKQQSPQF